jgi:hypothetical protein
MDKQPETRIPWGKVAGIALLLVAAIYASQHPHSFMAHVVKIILLPIP